MVYVEKDVLPALSSTPQHSKQAKTVEVSPILREKVLAFSRFAQVPFFPGSFASGFT